MSDDFINEVVYDGWVLRCTYDGVINGEHVYTLQVGLGSTEYIWVKAFRTKMSERLRRGAKVRVKGRLHFNDCNNPNGGLMLSVHANSVKVQ